ncbi:MAG TPA: AAA family ATPase [Candidatus Binatia bacterium]|nr:AAA family ATPase [Candidatus Binatia bacterium]
MPEQISALLLGADAAVLADVKGLLDGLDAAPASCTGAPLEDGVRLAQELNPEVIAVVLDGNPRIAFALIEDVSRALPSAYIFALSQDDSTENIIKAMRAGATEFLSLPLDTSQAVRALIKVTALRRLAHPTGKPAQVLTLYSPKGGAGVTTLAVNLALEIQARGKSVCVVDLDFQSSDIALFLNVNPLYTMMDITLNFRRLDSVFLQGTLTRHPSGVYVLAAPSHGTDAPNIPVEQVRAVLDLLRTMYDVVIVDTPRALAGETLAAFSAASRVVLVIDLSLPFLRGYRRTMAVLEGLGVPADRVDVVVTRHGGGRAQVPLEEAKKTLGLTVTHTLPRDDENALAAVNKGVPLSSVKAGAPLTRAIAQLAEMLVGREAGAGEREPKKRKGILAGLFAS